MDFVELCNQIERQFGEPFLPKGFVNAWARPEGDSFILQIGRREVEFNSYAEVLSSGTFVGAEDKWRVAPLTETAALVQKVTDLQRQLAAARKIGGV